MVLAQKRNDSKIDANWFTDTMTEIKDLPAEALRDLIVCSIAVKYTQVHLVQLLFYGGVAYLIFDLSSFTATFMELTDLVQYCWIR